ncbi:tRNA (adenosine(37)-N6)-threonylcarbamoyltransferase complex ATPase subunit type 1 TsaE [Gulosibacter sp. 10]|uniref:tRNA (adenosine(37)-N6)-threonylcarbamoyltransferase complex ATPase subunit type 1 TsaE n=1 Tax=Gulosibacter sp. 10 TaxID=1255570 RepID=UPI00097EE991|nr:tRNA (adenosine(37)-N6)-threonylcarbamoyltransferase complex ATPase subunit type 1 TsaE [Gulosibacter sp. 10]SJM58328.1 TsaE protein, required for threonylcarbamoyladenosine t(6)A37 formation in tRNA [Gulosibacter sp. 10]
MTTAGGGAQGEAAGELRTAEAMERFGARLAGLLGAGDVLVLTGPLGAGKTTLVRGLGEALGVRGTVASPTFVIARTHPSLEGGPALIHVDAYRLGSALELDDLDLDFEASVTVIEWGAEYVAALADDWLEVVIDRPRAGGEGPVAASAAAGSAVSADEADAADAPEDEPRAVRIRAMGERWRDVDLGALLEH